MGWSTLYTYQIWEIRNWTLNFSHPSHQIGRRHKETAILLHYFHLQHLLLFVFSFFYFLFYFLAYFLIVLLPLFLYSSSLLQLTPLLPFFPSSFAYLPSLSSLSILLSSFIASFSLSPLFFYIIFLLRLWSFSFSSLMFLRVCYFLSMPAQLSVQGLKRLHWCT